MFWSPDGSRAAYRIENRGYLLDENGTVLADLGDSSGGFAWSADSKALYYATVENTRPDAPPATIKYDWLPNPPALTAPVTQPLEPAKYPTLHLSSDGKSTALFFLPYPTPIWYLLISPDQNWLAGLASNKDVFKGDYSLYVYCIKSKQLYLVSGSCASAITFTGPARLAYVEPSRPGDDVDGLVGQIVEMTLDENAGKLQRQPVLEAIPKATVWMQSLAEDLFFTAAPRSFPANIAEQQDEGIFKLYHFSRANRSLTVIADDVGGGFWLSPDGRKILFEKITPQTPQKSKSRAIAVMNVNGSDSHVLRDLHDSDQMPMWPSWRKSDEIVCFPPISPAVDRKGIDGDKVLIDVVLYRLTPQHQLQEIRTLSKDWPVEMKTKPSYGPKQAATQPATP
jgi:hypothetical protein